MIVPGYTDLTEIGRGGFATVFRARQVNLGREVAVKVLARHDLASSDRTRFEREAGAMAALAWHPHVVTIFDAGSTDTGALWLAMELLEEGSLADIVADEGAMPWPLALRWAVQLGSALDVAHRAGILHRDVKPQNALVSRTGDVKLGDFGIVAYADSTRTSTGVVTGTVLHAAPEVLNGERASVASDVYSLASTLWELLSGRPAFFRETDDMAVAIAVRVIRDPLPEIEVGVPDAVIQVLRRGMAKEPAQRFASADELARAIQQIEIDQGLPATPITTAYWETTPRRSGRSRGATVRQGLGMLPPDDAAGATTPAASTPGSARHTPRAAQTPVPPLPEPQHVADHLDHPAPSPTSASAAPATSAPLPAVTVARVPPAGPPSSVGVGGGGGGRGRRLAVVVAVVMVVVAAGVVAALSLSGGDDGLDPAVADAFDGDAVELDRWTLQTASENESDTQVEVRGGRLVLTSSGDPRPARGGIKLTCAVQDFDVRVSVELLEWPTGSGGRVGFEVEGANTSYARADYLGDIDKLTFDTYDFDVADPESVVVAADVDALALDLRIVRVGGTSTGYWRPAGTTEWREVASGAVADTAPAVIRLTLWGAYGQPVQATFDNFEVYTPDEPCT
jgi:serine/threonine protein kinase